MFLKLMEILTKISYPIQRRMKPPPGGFFMLWNKPFWSCGS